MDCDKFEATMLDELYGELDELTSAASKRHASGCARCALLMAGLRTTRKLATLPTLEPSDGFERRIVAAVRAEEAKAKPALTFTAFLSRASRWAMQPQTAMAAVFLLIVGTSSLLLSRRGPKSAALEGAGAVTVTENGAPASPIPTFAMPPAMGSGTKTDLTAAAAAHGTPPLPALRAAPAKPMPLAEGEAADDSMLRPAHASGGAETDVASAAPPAAAGPLARGRTSPDALSAARSLRDGPPGCAAAAARFDQVATTAWGTSTGYDATLEGAECYARLGQVEAARSRYDRLLTAPGYAERAQAGINGLRPALAARAAAPRAFSSAPAAAPASPPP